MALHTHLNNKYVRQWFEQVQQREQKTLLLLVNYDYVVAKSQECGFL